MMSFHAFSTYERVVAVAFSSLSLPLRYVCATEGIKHCLTAAPSTARAPGEVKKDEEEKNESGKHKQ